MCASSYGWRESTSDFLAWNSSYTRTFPLRSDTRSKNYWNSKPDGMAFKYVTAILTDSPNTEFASPSRSSVHATADAIESLRSFAPGVPLVIVFDGITVPQRRMFGSKCGSPVRNASEYLKHIERVRSLAIATMLQSVQIIIAPDVAVSSAQRTLESRRSAHRLFS